MPSDELSWQGVYWPLVGVALNTMIQPCGRVCGCDPKLHVYARSSPIVCAFDAAAVLFRFLLHLQSSRSPFVAAKWTLVDREAVHRPGPRETFDVPMLLKLIIFVVGPVYCFGKLAASHGIGWTQTWAWCYVVSYFAVWVLRVLAAFAKEEMAPLHVSRRPKFPLKRVDQSLGVVALGLQILVLAWVDLAAIPPDTNLFSRYIYQSFRLGGLVVAMVIHYMFTILESKGERPGHDIRRLLSVFLTLVILALMLIFHVLGKKYTQMYYFFSVISAVGSWLLFWSPYCSELVIVSGKGDWQSVVSFDFFCRIFALSIFWYSTSYNAAGTWEPDWAEVFG